MALLHGTAPLPTPWEIALARATVARAIVAYTDFTNGSFTPVPRGYQATFGHLAEPERTFESPDGRFSANGVPLSNSEMAANLADGRQARRDEIGSMFARAAAAMIRLEGLPPDSPAAQQVHAVAGEMSRYVASGALTRTGQNFADNDVLAYLATAPVLAPVAGPRVPSTPEPVVPPVGAALQTLVAHRDRVQQALASRDSRIFGTEIRNQIVVATGGAGPDAVLLLTAEDRIRRALLTHFWFTDGEGGRISVRRFRAADRRSDGQETRRLREEWLAAAEAVARNLDLPPDAVRLVTRHALQLSARTLEAIAGIRQFPVSRSDEVSVESVAIGVVEDLGAGALGPSLGDPPALQIESESRSFRTEVLSAVNVIVVEDMVRDVQSQVFAQPAARTTPA